MGELAPLDLFAVHMAANTSRAYAADWRDFEGWCRRRGHAALPAEPNVLIAFLADSAERLKVSSLERRMAAISWQHQHHGFESPTHRTIVRRALRTLRRQRGSPPVQKDPILAGDLVAMLGALPPNIAGQRDRALLLAGFLGGFRRSELVALNVEDLEFTAEGVAVRINRSKTDQDGRGRRVGLPAHADEGLCPGRALRRWLAAAAIASGAIFRPIDRHGRVKPERLSSQAVSIVLKRYAGITGLNPDRVGGHSLRAGLVTSAARSGKPERVIMAQTGHRSIETVRRYIREATLFQENAADGLLLDIRV